IADVAESLLPGRLLRGGDPRARHVAGRDRADAVLSREGALEPSRAASEDEKTVDAGRKVFRPHPRRPVALGTARHEPVEVSPDDRRRRPDLRVEGPREVAVVPARLQHLWIIFESRVPARS